MEKKFTKNYKIYKPNKDMAGASSQFCFSKDKECVFLEMAKQLQEKGTEGFSLFDWKNKIVYKLGTIDLAEILLVLRGVKNGAGPTEKDNTEKYKGLFHSNENGNSILKFEKGKYDGYYLGLNIKRGDSAPISIKHSITSAEGMILQILLCRAIELIYDWN